MSTSEPGHDAAAQHPVEFVVVRDGALLLGIGNLRNRPGLVGGLGAAGAYAPAALFGFIFFLYYFFHEGVPLAAGRAFAQPLGRLLPAVLAEIGGFYFSH
jgi:hypothetical protein